MVIDLKQNEKDDAVTYREIYFFHHNLNRQERKGDFNDFFGQFDINIDLFADEIIFLEVDTAWQYSRFIDNNHAVVKAYVPEYAIEGRSYGLTLKKGFLSTFKVHGCFPGWAKGMIYVKNPYFDDSLIA